jgi:hypothetical protein
MCNNTNYSEIFPINYNNDTAKFYLGKRCVSFKDFVVVHYYNNKENECKKRFNVFSWFKKKCGL